MRRRPLSLPLVMALVLTALVGCTRPPDLVGVDNPEFPARAVADITKHRIFITTTRQAAEVQAAFFSGRRAPELRHLRRWLGPILQELDSPRPLMAGWFAASSGGCLFPYPEGDVACRYIEVGMES